MTEKFSEKTQKIEWLPNRQLSVIWIQSQRLYKETRARKIADNFDPDRFDPIRVTLPNGKGEYHIVDGQHRKAAVEMLWGSSEKVPCIVLDAENPAEAAKLFDGINGLRYGVDPVSKFKVRVTAGEPVEVAINKIVEHRGYKIASGRSENPRYGRSITAVGALIAVYTTHGPKVLDDILQILSATWPSDPYAPSASIIRGYGLLLGEFGSKVDWGRLKALISGKYTPGSLLTQARELRHTYEIPMGEAVLRVILAKYNRGLPETKQLKRGVTRAVA
jgi:ParB-like nuclease domain